MLLVSFLSDGYNLHRFSDALGLVFKCVMLNITTYWQIINLSFAFKIFLALKCELKFKKKKFCHIGYNYIQISIH